MWEYLIAIFNIKTVMWYTFVFLWSFGILFHRFGLFYQLKSGNPEPRRREDNNNVLFNFLFCFVF
jgi:hypothetical protein